MAKAGDTCSELPVDRLILAIGSVPASRIISTTEGIEVNERGYVLTRDTPYGMTTRKGVFAGGDVTDRNVFSKYIAYIKKKI